MDIINEKINKAYKKVINEVNYNKPYGQLSKAFDMLQKIKIGDRGMDKKLSSILDSLDELMAEISDEMEED